MRVLNWPHIVCMGVLGWLVGFGLVSCQSAFAQGAPSGAGAVNDTSLSIVDSNGTCTISNVSGPIASVSCPFKSAYLLGGVVDAGTLQVTGNAQIVGSCGITGVSNELIADAGTLWVHTTSNLDGVTNASSIDAGVVTSAGAITGATTCDITGIITGHNQVRSYNQTIAGYNSFNYSQFTGSATGAPVTWGPIGGDSNVSIALQPIGTGTVTSNHGFQSLAMTLDTCAGGLEGRIEFDSASGVSTGHQTRICVCLSNGSATYAWKNMLNPILGTGTATTCSD